jgi:hypothetical protein
MIMPTNTCKEITTRAPCLNLNLRCNKEKMPNRMMGIDAGYN